MELFSQVDLYPVITKEFCNGRSPFYVLEKVLLAGVKIVQLREKEIDKGALFDMAVRFRNMTKEKGALLIINDHVDVALAAEADGVHLGQRDLPLTAAKTIAPDLIIGVSTHTINQAKQAQSNGAGYVNIGPVYQTGTKPDHKDFLGPRGVFDISSRLTIPFTVMGGIKQVNAVPVLTNGARHIAVVTAVTAADNIEAATDSFRKKILSYR